MKTEDQHVSVADAARLLGLHREEAYRRVHSGEWSAVRIDRQLRVPIAALFDLQDETPAGNPIGNLVGASLTQQGEYQ